MKSNSVMTFKDGKCISKPKASDNGKPANPAPNKDMNKSSDRWQQLNAIVDKAARHLNSSQFKVMMILYRHELRGEVKLMSQDRIAKIAGLKSKRWVNDAIKRLSELGLIKVLRRGSKQIGCSTYKCTPECFRPPETKSVSSRHRPVTASVGELQVIQTPPEITETPETSVAVDMNL